MAQLRDTVVAGSLRATDTLFSTTAQFQILRVPTSSNGTTFGPGSANNLLKSNGTSVYWTTLVASDIPTISITDKTSGTLPVTRGGTGVTAIANIQAGKDGDGNTISSTYLKLSGGTLTGDLNIRKNSAWTLSLNNDINSGRHGLKSSGYGQYDGGLAWMESEAWLVYRDASGNVVLNGNATSATYVKDRTNNTATYLNYAAIGLSSDNVSWLACWNGYELRAISKDQLLMRYAWWNKEDSHNANDLHGGITFAYLTHSNTATVGTLVDFSCGGNNNYPLQIQGSYGNNELFFRNRDGDRGTWGEWLRVVTGLSVIPNITHSTVTPNYTSGGETYFKAAIKYLAQNYKFEDNLMGILAPNSQGPFIGNVYSFTDVNSSGLPRYSTFIFHNLGDGLESFGTNDYNFYYRYYLHNGNYTNYTVTKTGSGASGTWGINVTGSAGSVAWGNITGKPGLFTQRSLNDTNIDNTSGNWTTSVSDFSSAHGTFPYDSNTWMQIIQFDAVYFKVQLGITVTSSGGDENRKLWFRSRWVNNSWSQWHIVSSSGNGIDFGY